MLGVSTADRVQRRTSSQYIGRHSMSAKGAGPQGLQPGPLHLSVQFIYLTDGSCVLSLDSEPIPNACGSRVRRDSDCQDATVG